MRSDLLSVHSRLMPRARVRAGNAVVTIELSSQQSDLVHGSQIRQSSGRIQRRERGNGLRRSTRACRYVFTRFDWVAWDEDKSKAARVECCETNNLSAIIDRSWLC